MEISLCDWDEKEDKLLALIAIKRMIKYRVDQGLVVKRRSCHYVCISITFSLVVQLVASTTLPNLTILQKVSLFYETVLLKILFFLANFTETICPTIS